MRFLLFYPNTIFGQLISWYTRGPYCHIAVRFSDGIVYEAVEGVGVRCFDFSQFDKLYPKRKFDIYRFSSAVVNFDETKMRRFAESQLGKKYDWTSVFNFLLKFRKQEQRKSKGMWFCGEYAFAIIDKCFPLLKNIQPWQVSPNIFSYSPLLVFNGTMNIPNKDFDKNFDHIKNKIKVYGT